MCGYNPHIILFLDFNSPWQDILFPYSYKLYTNISVFGDTVLKFNVKLSRKYLSLKLARKYEMIFQFFEKTGWVNQSLFLLLNSLYTTILHCFISHGCQPIILDKRNHVMSKIQNKVEQYARNLKGQLCAIHIPVFIHPKTKRFLVLLQTKLGHDFHVNFCKSWWRFPLTRTYLAYILLASQFTHCIHRLL